MRKCWSMAVMNSTGLPPGKTNTFFGFGSGGGASSVGGGGATGGGGLGGAASTEARSAKRKSVSAVADVICMIRVFIDIYPSIKTLRPPQNPSKFFLRLLGGLLFFLGDG